MPASITRAHADRVAPNSAQELTPHCDPSYRQCLGKRRIASIQELTQQADAWNQRTNHAKTIIDWKFTRTPIRQVFATEPCGTVPSDSAVILVSPTVKV